MKLQIEKGYLSDFLTTIFSSFVTTATQKDIRYSYTVDTQIQSGYYDPDKLEKILFNLISNALKFTTSGESVFVRATVITDKLVVNVTDTGPGIAPEYLEHIFNRFYQVDDSVTRSRDGAGIGLALSKELAEIHRGSLLVTSTAGEGSTFTLSVPVTEAHYKNEINIASVSLYPRTFEGVDDKVNPTVEHGSSANKPVILIAEDNEDMRQFISQVLQSQFTIDIATDGLDAWEKIQVSVPDLVISDIMMPRLDGIKLCERIKTTTATSHIPIIMLTARADQESKISGLKNGADDYLVKPFDASELQVRIQNLIAQREQLRKIYQQHISLEPQGIPIVNPEIEFLRKVKEILEENYSNPDFDVEAFGKSAGLSRMQLHRKLKAVTTMSTGDFLRNFRIERAKQLLQSNSDLHIGEVADQCGFSNFSHFTKVFKEYTGQTPSDYIREKV
jgi:DNA-binding response OmpR family regulator